MSIFSKIFGSSKKATVPTVTQAIESADAAVTAAQREVNNLLAKLESAQTEKVRVLKASQAAIQAALASDQEKLQAAKVRHQEEMAELNASFQRQQEALERRMNQLAEIKTSTVEAVETQFGSVVGDANSRANIAARELARLQSLLGDTEEQ